MTRARWMVVAAVVALATIVAVVALAERASEPGMMGQGGMMGGPGMMGQDMGMMGMCPVHGGMMAGMMGRSALAVDGKNVYLFTGNKLLKYDSNLKLVREAEVKMDVAKMGAMVEKMMDQCPMRRQMMTRRRGMMGGPEE